MRSRRRVRREASHGAPEASAAPPVPASAAFSAPASTGAGTEDADGGVSANEWAPRVGPWRMAPAHEDCAWSSDAFILPYVGFDPTLLRANRQLFCELVCAAHLIETPLESAGSDGDDDADTPSPPVASVASYVGAVAARFSIDRPCTICKAIEAYRNEFGLCPQWVADYAMLCTKALSVAPCAVSVVAAAFELVYLMDKYFLAQHRATLVGAFAARTLTLVDVQRHFFLHCCFRTDGGLAGRYADRGDGTAQPGATKILYSNYSFLVQAVIRALFMTIVDGEEDGAASRGTGSPRGATQRALDAALIGWKECARSIDCAFVGVRKRTRRTCCDEARQRYADHDAKLRAQPTTVTSSDERWAYVDLALLLLGGIACDVGPVMATAQRARQALLDAYWKENLKYMKWRAAPWFRQFVRPGCAVNTGRGPVLATILKHTKSRGGTTGECLLCNLLPTQEYWHALRLLKEDAVVHSANNAALVDCIPSVLDTWRAQGKAPRDGGRFLAIVSALSTEAVYKHFFCDPLCALAELQTDPATLFGHPADGDDLELYKARLASENKFEGRVCAGLWAVAYTFKTFQVFPPPPTISSRFLKEASLTLRRHGIPLVSLEHTLCNYV